VNAVKVTTGKIYVGEEALRLLDKILEEQKDQEKNKKPNGKAVEH